MSRAPEFGPSLDTIPAASLTDPEPARSILLRTADRRAHALQTGWGARAHQVSCRIDAGETLTLQLPVPPGVTYMRVWALMHVIHKLTVSSDTDTTGIIMELGQSVAFAGGVEVADWLATTTIAPVTSGAGLWHLQVAASASWDWQLEGITLVGATGGACYGVAFEPVHLVI